MLNIKAWAADPYPVGSRSLKSIRSWLNQEPPGFSHGVVQSICKSPKLYQGTFFPVLVKGREKKRRRQGKDLHRLVLFVVTFFEFLLKNRTPTRSSFG